jgi:hypothetical protein
VTVTVTRLNATVVTSTFDGGPNAGSLMSINLTVNGGHNPASFRKDRITRGEQ